MTSLAPLTLFFLVTVSSASCTRLVCFIFCWKLWVPRGALLHYALSQKLMLTLSGAGGQLRADLTQGPESPLSHGEGVLGSQPSVRGIQGDLCIWMAAAPAFCGPQGLPSAHSPSGAHPEHAQVRLLTLVSPPPLPSSKHLSADPDFRHAWARVHTLTFNSDWPSRTSALPELPRAVRTPEFLRQDTIKLPVTVKDQLESSEFITSFCEGRSVS